MVSTISRLCTNYMTLYSRYPTNCFLLVPKYCIKAMSYHDHNHFKYGIMGKKCRTTWIPVFD